MSSITIHAMEPSVDLRLSERARLAGISKNQLIKDLLAQATGLATKQGYATDYKEFCGVWSVAEQTEFYATQAANSHIDGGDWKA